MKNGVQPFFTQQTPRTVLGSVLLLSVALAWYEPLRSCALTILRFPFAVTKTVVGIIVTLPRLPALTHENVSLQSALTQRELELAQLREALRHAQHTQALLTDAPPSSSIAATVIDRSMVPTQQTIVLDRGTRDGLTLESVIIDTNGVIGRVVSLQPSTCIGLLLTDPESRVSGLIERSRETGLLVGRGQGTCEFIYLDAHADIQEGDRIVTAGLGGLFPKGLWLGTVVRIVREETSGTASAWVAPAARFGQLEEVLCLLPTERLPRRVGKP